MGSQISYLKTDKDRHLIEKGKDDIHDRFLASLESHWLSFLEENCICSSDKYAPIKTVIAAFTHYLRAQPEFVALFEEYQSKYGVYPEHGIWHSVAFAMESLVKKIPGLQLSVGFYMPHGSRNKYDFSYTSYIDERMVIGVSVERFLKA
jgi:hypothetical protein